MNKNNKIIAIVVSALLIVITSITFGMKMKENKRSLQNSNSSKNREIEIEDTCSIDSVFPDAIEKYYEDSKYICTFNQIKSSCYVVKVDGKEYSLKEALENKVITIEEAIEKGLHCEMKDTGSEDKESDSPSNTNTNSNTTNTNINSNSNSNSNNPSNTNVNSNTNTNSPVNSNSNIISSSNVVSSSNIQNNTGIKVVNRCSGNTTQQIDEFYQDNEYIYYFNSGISGCTYVNVNGKEYTLRNALNNKIVTMKELEAVGFKCLKKSKNLVDK